MTASALPDLTLDPTALAAACRARCWALERDSRRALTAHCNCRGECEEDWIASDPYIEAAISAYLSVASGTSATISRTADGQGQGQGQGRETEPQKG